MIMRLWQEMEHILSVSPAFPGMDGLYQGKLGGYLPHVEKHDLQVGLRPIRSSLLELHRTIPVPSQFVADFCIWRFAG